MSPAIYRNLVVDTFPALAAISIFIMILGASLGNTHMASRFPNIGLILIYTGGVLGIILIMLTMMLGLCP